MAKAQSASTPIPGDGALFHLDDFLNAMEQMEQKIESLSAFALVKKTEGTIKKTWDEWLKDFRTFEQSIPD